MATTTERIDWPSHLDRTPTSMRYDRSNFSVSLAKAVSDLEAELDRVGATQWSVDFGNNHSKSNGMPLHNANPADPGFVLRWEVDGEAHAIACDSYQTLRDNVREIGKWMKETRLRNQRDVEVGGSNFAAAALPSGDASEMSESPYAILGLEPGASDAEIAEAYRDRSKETHPDNGGDEGEYKKVQSAKRMLLEDNQ